MLTVCHQLYKNGTIKKQQNTILKKIKEMVNNHFIERQWSQNLQNLLNTKNFAEFEHFCVLS